MTTPQTDTAARPEFADRVPLLEAFGALGVRDAKIARALGYSSVFVTAWRTGKRPIPHKTQAALLFVVGRLTGQIGANVPPKTKYARRAQVAVKTAMMWANLARNEFAAELGSDDPGRDFPDLAAEAFELGKRVLAHLEEGAAGHA
jgi:hypothetical protein